LSLFSRDCSFLSLPELLETSSSDSSIIPTCWLVRCHDESKLIPIVHVYQCCRLLLLLCLLERYHLFTQVNLRGTDERNSSPEFYSNNPNN
jgi:hypothetical protein